MGWIILARVLFIASVGWVATQISPLPWGWPVNLAFGAGLAGVIVFAETRLHNTGLPQLLGALLGGAAGLGIAKTIESSLFWTNADDPRVAFLRGAIVLVLPYVGMMVGARKGEWLEPARLVSLFRSTGRERRYKILDTSVIIDGRIADVCDTGFIDGTLVIPQFVLKELQLVADSGDTLKRNRGRRGLDILHRIQKSAGVEVMVSDVDFPDVKDVDMKLIELARQLEGKIVTNDFNLNKVAQLRGVDVLNLNLLANSLKPVVLPGEVMKVFILKEGKEYNQGVAYLDDGTMVVVDNARRLIGRTIDVVVTSVLQTTAGKMIFGRFIEGGAAASGTPADRTAAPERPAAAKSAPEPQVAAATQPPTQGQVDRPGQEDQSVSRADRTTKTEAVVRGDRDEPGRRQTRGSGV